MSTRRDTTNIPLDLKGMPSMAELLDPKSNEPTEIGNSPQNKKQYPKKRIKLTETYSPQLELSNLPTMLELLDAPKPDSSATAEVDSGKRSTELLKNCITGLDPPSPPIPTENINLDSFEVLYEKAEKTNVFVGEVIREHHGSIEVLFDQDKKGVVHRFDFDKKEPLKPRDKVLVQLENKELSKAENSLIYLKTLSRSKIKQTKKKRAHKINISGKQFVIDGSNICRSYTDSENKSTIIPLITLVANLLLRKATCCCIFDANERYILRQNLKEPFGEKVYDHLVIRYPEMFREVPGGSNADETILLIAERNSSAIISNDNFNKPDDPFVHRYLWLTTDSKRLFKGSVENGMLIVDQLEILEPLPTSPQKPFCQIQQFFLDRSP